MGREVIIRRFLPALLRAAVDCCRPGDDHGPRPDAEVPDLLPRGDGAAAVARRALCAVEGRLRLCCGPADASGRCDGAPAARRRVAALPERLGADRARCRRDRAVAAGDARPGDGAARPRPAGPHDAARLCRRARVRTPSPSPRTGCRPSRSRSRPHRSTAARQWRTSSPTPSRFRWGRWPAAGSAPSARPCSPRDWRCAPRRRSIPTARRRRSSRSRPAGWRGATPGATASSATSARRCRRAGPTT